MAPVLKTGVGASSPGVRIPPHPPSHSPLPSAAKGDETWDGTKRGKWTARRQPLWQSSEGRSTRAHSHICSASHEARPLWRWERALFLLLIRLARRAGAACPGGGKRRASGLGGAKSSRSPKPATWRDEIRRKAKAGHDPVAARRAERARNADIRGDGLDARSPPARDMARHGKHTPNGYRPGEATPSGDRSVAVNRVQSGDVL